MTAAEYNKPIYALIAIAEDKASEARKNAENANYIAACEYLMEAEAYEAKANECRSWLM